MAPGLYEVTCSFFTAHSPTVQLFVNGEPVLTASEASHSKIRYAPSSVASAFLQLPPSAHRHLHLLCCRAVVRRGRHSVGNVTGLSIKEFLALPARSQISLTYDGTDSAQGFLCLRKL